MQGQAHLNGITWSFHPCPDCIDGSRPAARTKRILCRTCNGYSHIRRPMRVCEIAPTRNSFPRTLPKTEAAA